MIPKINFVYSLPYDRLFTLLNKKKFNEKQTSEIKECIKGISEKWNRLDKKILNTISLVSGLKWKNVDKINCYIIKELGIFKAISNPLTIEMMPVKNFISVLIHELIHINLTQSEQSKNELLKLLEKRFSKEDFHTKIHILVYLIERKVKRILRFKPQKLRKKDKKRIEMPKKFRKGYEKARKIASEIDKKIPDKKVVYYLKKYLTTK